MVWWCTVHVDGNKVHGGYGPGERNDDGFIFETGGLIGMWKWINWMIVWCVSWSWSVKLWTCMCTYASETGRSGLGKYSFLFSDNQYDRMHTNFGVDCYWTEFESARWFKCRCVQWRARSTGLWWEYCCQWATATVLRWNQIHCDTRTCISMQKNKLATYW